MPRISGLHNLADPALDEFRKMYAAGIAAGIILAGVLFLSIDDYRRLLSIEIR
jgi:hypothetical protein